MSGAQTPAPVVDKVAADLGVDLDLEAGQSEQPEADEPAPPVEEEHPSAEERKGMRGHDDEGNVRPADGRWDLHRPEDESKVTAS